MDWLEVEDWCKDWPEVSVEEVLYRGSVEETVCVNFVKQRLRVQL